MEEQDKRMIRAMEMVVMSINGSTRKEICSKFKLAKSTVDQQMRFLFQEYKAINMPHLVAILFRQKLIN